MREGGFENDDDDDEMTIFMALQKSILLFMVNWKILKS